MVSRWTTSIATVRISRPVLQRCRSCKQNISGLQHWQNQSPLLYLYVDTVYLTPLLMHNTRKENRYQNTLIWSLTLNKMTSKRLTLFHKLMPWFAWYLSLLVEVNLLAFSHQSSLGPILQQKSKDRYDLRYLVKSFNAGAINHVHKPVFIFNQVPCGMHIQYLASQRAK